MPKEKVKEFLSAYLRAVQELGLDEMEELIQITNAKNNNIQMKNYDLDYWIIGYHSLGFEDYVGDGIKLAATLLPFILSLGTFPLWDDVSVRSTFFVFDKNLKSLKTLSLR